jgi:hypothetical protein
MIIKFPYIFHAFGINGNEVVMLARIGHISDSVIRLMFEDWHSAQYGYRLLTPYKLHLTALDASSKVMPCLRLLTTAFFGSHSKCISDSSFLIIGGAAGAFRLTRVVLVVSRNHLLSSLITSLVQNDLLKLKKIGFTGGIQGAPYKVTRI